MPLSERDYMRGPQPRRRLSRVRLWGWLFCSFVIAVGGALASILAFAWGLILATIIVLAVGLAAMRWLFPSA